MYVNLGRRDGSVRRNGSWLPAGVLAAAAVTVLALAGCSSGSSEAASGGISGGANPPAGQGEQQAAPPPAAKPAASIKLLPAAGAQDVSPAEPISVTVTDGTIQSLTLTNPDGKQVA